MYDFLFDIKPNAHQLCPVARLARLINSRKYRVYYTDTSDSALTYALLDEGIGRMLYPDDLRWLVPDLVLLDPLLQEREKVYRTCRIDYLFLSVQHTQEKTASLNGVPVIQLTPYPYPIGTSTGRLQDFLDKLAEIKQNEAPTIIIGLLEEEEHPYESDLLSFYKAIQKSGTEHPEYQFIVLTNEGVTENVLFTLPGNVAVYRQTDLYALLPLCDMALISDQSYAQTACIFAEVPAITFSPKEMQNITPGRLNKRIVDAAHNSELIIKKQNELGNYYKQESLKLDQIADQLVNRIIHQKQHE